jgi:hypothetical protein
MPGLLRPLGLNATLASEPATRVEVQETSKGATRERGCQMPDGSGLPGLNGHILLTYEDPDEVWRDCGRCDPGARRPAPTPAKLDVVGGRRRYRRRTRRVGLALHHKP